MVVIIVIVVNVCAIYGNFTFNEKIVETEKNQYVKM